MFVYDILIDQFFFGKHYILRCIHFFKIAEVSSIRRLFPLRRKVISIFLPSTWNCEKGQPYFCR